MTQMPLRIFSRRTLCKNHRFIKTLLPKAFQLGTKATVIEDILQILEIRFQASATSVKPGLEAIDDTQRLKALLREAVETPTLAAFIDKL